MILYALKQKYSDRAVRCPYFANRSECVLHQSEQEGRENLVPRRIHSWLSMGGCCSGMTAILAFSVDYKPMALLAAPH